MLGPTRECSVVSDGCSQTSKPNVNVNANANELVNRGETRLSSVALVKRDSKSADYWFRSIEKHTTFKEQIG